MGTTSPSRSRQRWGPWVLLAGFLLASLGGLTNSDCFLCTLTELLPVGIGSVVVLVGAAMSLLRRDRRILGRVLAVVVATSIILALSLTVRIFLPMLLWESPHAEATQP